jgi:hypothetical protein
MSGTPSQSDPNTWFAVLRAAREAGDRDLQAMARRELDSMGYRVVIRRDRDQPGQRDQGEPA